MIKFKWTNERSGKDGLSKHNKNMQSERGRKGGLGGNDGQDGLNERSWKVCSSARVTGGWTE